jgi:hypothetical protein
MCGTFYGYEEQYLLLAAQTHLFEAKIMCPAKHTVKGLRRKTQHIFVAVEVQFYELCTTLSGDMRYYVVRVFCVGQFRSCLQILNTCGIIEAKFEFSPKPPKLEAYLFRAKF